MAFLVSLGFSLRLTFRSLAAVKVVIFLLVSAPLRLLHCLDVLIRPAQGPEEVTCVAAHVYPTNRQLELKKALSLPRITANIGREYTYEITIGIKCKIII